MITEFRINYFCIEMTTNESSIIGNLMKKIP